MGNTGSFGAPRRNVSGGDVENLRQASGFVGQNSCYILARSVLLLESFNDGLQKLRDRS